MRHRPLVAAALVAAACAGPEDVGTPGDDDLGTLTPAVTEPSGVAAWTRLVKGGTQQIRDVAADRHAGAILTGSTRDPIEVGGKTIDIGPDAFDLDIFLVKYDPYGNVVWVRLVGSRGSEDDPYRIAVTGDDDVIVVAQGESLDFGCGGVGGHAAIARLDGATGTCVWSWPIGVSFDGARASFGTLDLAVDANGRIDVVGFFGTFIAWPGGPTSPGAPFGNPVGFVTQLDDRGMHVWTHVIGEQGGFSAVDTAEDGTIFAVGDFRGTIDLGGMTLTSDDDVRNGFLARYSPSGNLLSVRRYGGGWVTSLAIDVARDGRHVIGGHFETMVDVGGGVTLTTPGTTADLFVAKYGPDGALRWARHPSGTAMMGLVGVGLDGHGNVDVAIFVDPRTVPGGGTLPSSFHLGSSDWTVDGARNLFLIQFGPKIGGTRWVRRYGDDSHWIFPMAMDLTTNNRVLITGDLVDPVDFGSGPVSPGIGNALFLTRIYP